MLILNLFNIFLSLSFFLSLLVLLNSFDLRLSHIINDYENSITAEDSYETNYSSLNLSEKNPKKTLDPKRYWQTKIIKIRKRKTTKSTSLSKNCGSPIILPSISVERVKRIINGSIAVLYSWPWVISIREILGLSYDHICGGTIISDRYVLTAAHCVRDFEDKRYVIMVGLNDLNEQITLNNSVEIEKVIIHPGYDDRFKNDLAIVKLKRKLIFSYKIAAICLPSYKNRNISFSKKVVVVGWGSVTGQRPGTSPNLKQTILEIINNKTNNTCNKNMIDLYCAIDLSESNSNICYGDSGGPMMVKENNTWFLYGIANFLTGFSSTKCDNTRPSYYIVVTNYLEWIYTIIS